MPPSVFISYSHKDEVWKDRLLTHLRISEKEGLLQLWDDRRIAVGTDWRPEIQKALDAAAIGILLISADFLVSDFIRGEEIPRMLERRSKDGMHLFPVMVRSCDWQIVPWLSPIQIRPIGARPLADFRGDRRDAEMAAVARELRGLLAAIPPVSTALPILHQLPTPPADFTGRQEDLDFLRSHLAPGKPGAIFGLRGMGGVGKTTLALELAAELKPEFPDAQIYLDLKGVNPQPLTAAQAMAHVIRAFYPETRLPEGDAEVAGLYRTVLDGKRVLLLMDNAAGKEQVQPLVPPSTCLLLVTSRFRFALPGLVDRDLDEMSGEEARDLLVRIAPRIGDAADEIAGLCGRLPLALRLAGSALAERPSLSASEYVRRLKEGQEGFSDVEAALDLSYKLLDEERRYLWRLLAVFPGTFDVSAAAALWELEREEAQSGLEEMVRISLVDWEEKEERYRLHDLSRSFAEKSLGAAKREAGQRRLSEHFLRVLESADDLYRQGGGSIAAALTTFDTEWGNIQAGHGWAARHAQEDMADNKLCSHYPNAGAFILELRQNVQERIRWGELGVAAARQRNDRMAEEVLLGNLGNAYNYLGETRRAIELFEQALIIDREIGDRQGEGTDLGSLGLAYADLGEIRRAIEFYEQYLAIARETGDRRGEGNALGNMGNAYKNLGEIQRAIEFYELRLVIAREIGDRRGEGSVLGNMGNAYKNLGETHRAMEFYEQQLAIAREVGDQRLQGIANWNLGLTYEKEGDLARAADLMQVLVEFEREIGHSDAEKRAARVAAIRARIAEQNP